MVGRLKTGSRGRCGVFCKSMVRLVYTMEGASIFGELERILLIAMKWEIYGQGVDELAPRESGLSCSEFLSI